ncbi:collagen alpha-1(I) chain-like [Mastomys coucha]|uniref:collagen alpha-1(I) chain-like n=1 Tax=Mastomys coucha TaxID=35658 RepID=UPI0012618F72|nr:collagen alpha-1(I) chain-like [Mastomys coucha]
MAAELRLPGRAISAGPPHPHPARGKRAWDGSGDPRTPRRGAGPGSPDGRAGEPAASGLVPCTRASRRGQGPSPADGGGVGRGDNSGSRGTAGRRRSRAPAFRKITAPQSSPALPAPTSPPFRSVPSPAAHKEASVRGGGGDGRPESTPPGETRDGEAGRRGGRRAPHPGAQRGSPEPRTHPGRAPPRIEAREPRSRHVTAASPPPSTQREPGGVPGEAGEPAPGNRGRSQPELPRPKPARTPRPPHRPPRSHSSLPGPPSPPPSKKKPKKQQRFPSHLARGCCPPPRGRVPGGPRHPRPGALRRGRRHEVGHSPPPRRPCRAGPGPRAHWLSGV